MNFANLLSNSPPKAFEHSDTTKPMLAAVTKT